jgi:hypothetical protein
MGALAGFRYRDIIKRLKALGLEFHRQRLVRMRSGSTRT